MKLIVKSLLYIYIKKSIRNLHGYCPFLSAAKVAAIILTALLLLVVFQDLFTNGDRLF